MDILDYDHDRDFEAVKRIHTEVGWISNDRQGKALEGWARALTGIVLPVNGEAECAVFTAPGGIRHLHTELTMTAVIAVTTSHVARRLGAAKKLTTEALARAAAAGSEVATLGMFDQGFYDLLGFGTGAYSRWLRFDPATLVTGRRVRPPRRLTKDNWRDIHQAMHARLRGHGGCVLNPPEILCGELAGVENLVALGYFDGADGSLSHFIVGHAKAGRGPYHINYYGYQNTDQLFDLLALINALGDQVWSFVMEEPPEIQIQDLLQQPYRNRDISEGSKHSGLHRTYAYWQARILNLEQCLAKTHLDAEDVTFNLCLTDPIAEYLDAAHSWRGVAGDYVVTLGEVSTLRPGQAAKLPTLHASVGAFTRLWLGVRNASSLALTDSLRGDADLLLALDRALRLPRPHFGWDF